ncbi:superoxide dismutase 2 [Rhodnius prolixus]|uniref:Superoxide dismutase n=1 Tax=Rhodnius prolixus TaxID=13249 RepID=R4FJZ0_RHOPR
MMYALRRGLTAFNRNACNIRQKHTLPELPYALNALEPVISAEIMEVHYKKHHAAYVNNYNAAEEKLSEALSKKDVDTIVLISSALKFHGGGHLNHSMYWCNLSPDGGKPSDELTKAICTTFGSFDEMKKQMMTMTNAIQGSGWGWLGLNPLTKKLQLATTGNQDLLRDTTGLIPLLGIDVWEHAYYLQYKNVRADYTKKIFDIVNWHDVNNRFKTGLC